MERPSQKIIGAISAVIVASISPWAALQFKESRFSIVTTRKMLAIDSLLSGESIADLIGFEPIFTWINSPVPYQVGDGPLPERKSSSLAHFMELYHLFWEKSTGENLLSERGPCPHIATNCRRLCSPLYPASAAR